MKIIIVGCGKVGMTLAEHLSSEDYEVTLIDQRSERIHDVVNNFDVTGIVGNGSSFNLLKEAGIDEADLFIAITNSDEINLLCCLIAKKAGHCQTIARVRNPIYRTEHEFIRKELGLSMIINPDYAAATEIARLLRVPQAMEINTFAKGRVELLKFKIKPGISFGWNSIENGTSTFTLGLFDLYC